MAVPPRRRVSGSGARRMGFLRRWCMLVSFPALLSSPPSCCFGCGLTDVWGNRIAVRDGIGRRPIRTDADGSLGGFVRCLPGQEPRWYEPDNETGETFDLIKCHVPSQWLLAKNSVVTRKPIVTLLLPGRDAERCFKFRELALFVSFSLRVVYLFLLSLRNRGCAPAEAAELAEKDKMGRA